MIERNNFFIGGEWVSPTDTEAIEVICPATEEKVGSVPRAGATDVDRAVSAARRAFDEGPWPRMSLADRISVVEAARQAILDRAEDLARCLTLEQGTPHLKAREGVVGSPLDYIDDAIAAARQLLSEPEIRVDQKGTTLILKDPVGVCAGITPFNGPLITAVLKVIPAILAGCTVILKPSQLTPLDNYVFAEALRDSGLPDGVLNLVPGDAVAGECLVRHPGVDKVGFTGSSAAGRRIAAICGQQMKRSHMELGGKSAAIVLEDADLEACLPKLAAGALASQVCIALSRVLVPRSRHDEIVEALCSVAADYRPGDPFDASTTMSPLISAQHRSRVLAEIRRAQDDGCTVAAGGIPPPEAGRGYYLEPTVLTGVANGMRVAREEIFGPVACVIHYEDVDEAVRIANDSDFGLHGAVFTSDLETGLSIARRVRTGTFAINTFGFYVSSPFGGVGGSGYGREHGPEGLSEYLQTKSVALPGGFVPSDSRAS